MKNFKVGDVVYDEVNYPNQKGIVQHSKLDSKYCVAVKFDNRLDCEFYTLDGKISDYSIPTLSHTPYTIEFKGFSQERPLKDAMKVCIKGDGTTEYGKKIIDYLKVLGGRNKYNYDGDANSYYFLNNDYVIYYSANIPEGYKEISLKEVEQVCYVGKKIFINNITYLIIKQDINYIYFIMHEEICIKISEIHNYKIID